MGREMTLKQKMFCDEYLIDLNATRAYKAVYKVEKDSTARTNGSKLLAKAHIRAYIDERLKEKEVGLVASQNEVLEYLTRVMRGESRSSVLAKNGLGVEQVIQKPPDEKEALKAAELLGKRYGLYLDRVEQETDMEISVSVDYGDDDK